VQSKLINDGGEKTFAIVFDTGDEVAAGLLDTAAHTSARRRGRTDVANG
jgi:hypothetical protein